MSREVPSGWKSVELGDVAKESRSRNSDLRIPDERLVGVFKDQGMVTMRERVRGTSVERCKVVRHGEFAYNPMRINIGSIARSTADVNLMVSPDYVVFSPDTTKIDGPFLDYLRKSDAWSKFVGNAGDGGVRIRIYFNHLARFRFNLPPLHDQRRIAEILSSVDEAIAATRAVIEQTRKVKLGVLERLLTKGIGHTRLKQTEIGEIPEGWEVKSIEELCVLSNGNGFRPPDWSDTGLPIIRIQNLNGGKHFNYFNGVPLDKWLINPGDLLFAWAGVRGVSFGPTIWQGPQGVLNQHIFKISCRDNVNKHWLFQTLKLITFKIEAKAHGFKDSLLHVHKKDITAQPVAVPPFAEQLEISNEAAELQRAEDVSQSSLDRLLSLRSGLMSDLLTGRKRVTDAFAMAAE